MPVVPRGHEHEGPSSKADAMTNGTQEVVICPVVADPAAARRQVGRNHPCHRQGVKDHLTAEIIAVTLDALRDRAGEVLSARDRCRVPRNGQRRIAVLDMLIECLRRENENRRQNHQDNGDDTDKDLPKGFHARRDWVNAGKDIVAAGTMICRMGRVIARRNALKSSKRNAPSAKRENQPLFALFNFALIN